MNTIVYYYRDYWNEIGDPRVVHYPLLNTPWPTILLILAYLYISVYAGRQYMKNRQPYDLKKAIFVYNVLLVYYNCYILVHGLLLTNFGLDTWMCLKIDKFSTSQKDADKIYYGWLYFVSKFIDFMDTFFFVLRKKDSHLSFLHLYHHAVMPLFSWLGVKLAPGGNTGFIPLVNAFVHVIMYIYYALSIFPSLRPYLWWKKYLTTLQLVQFVLIIIHSIYSMVNPRCEWPNLLIYISMLNALLFFHLFYSFFKATYKNKSKANMKTD